MTVTIDTKDGEHFIFENVQRVYYPFQIKESPYNNLKEDTLLVRGDDYLREFAFSDIKLIQVTPS